MAKFTTTEQIDFLNFDLGDLDDGAVTNPTATTFRREEAPPTDVIDFFGTAFTYTAGNPTGGTINHITSFNAAGSWDISSFSMTVAAANALIAAGNAQTFLGAVFAGNDSIAGSTFADQLLGYNGNDTIAGLGGLDTLQGGLGNDTYIVDNLGVVITEALSAGTDAVFSSVDLTLAANVENLTQTGSGNIAGTGNALANTLLGNSGNNSLAGGDLNDVLTGNVGNDTLDGGTGTDKMTGGAGDDLYRVADKTDTVTESVAGAPGGTDTVESSIAYTLGANVEHLTLTGLTAIDGTGNTLDNILTGNAQANKLTGLAGKDDLIGNAGNDTLDGGVGDDSMTGGADDDLYIQDSAGDVITENGPNVGLGDTLKTNQQLTDTTPTSNIEHYIFTGTKSVDFTGSAANNSITGTAAIDTLRGDAGDDTLIGLGGNDSLSGGDDNDSLDGGVGMDTMRGGDGDDTYGFDNAKDVVDETGTDGNDTVNASVTVTLASFVGIENITLTGAGAINATGNDEDNVLKGNAGANKLDGVLGDDTMDGGKGTDTYTVDSEDDQVSEDDAVDGGGVDTVISSVTHTLTPNIENLTLAVGSANINAFGNKLANTLTGNDGNNILDGKEGIDKLIGGKGNDTYVVDDLKDTVTESVAAGGGDDLVQSKVTFTLGQPRAAGPARRQQGRRHRQHAR
jgi:trimeric autotransporter adhesin